ncbi:MAG TPA: protein kinase [Phycisphaerae bacterium]|nr:protein kinase [Phycisphaerae bacterium]
MACLSREQLEVLARGAADCAEVQELSRHVDECPACRRAVEALRSSGATEVECDSPTILVGTGAQNEDGSDLDALAALTDSVIDCSSLLATAFPGYEIVRELHSGAQGIVYQAIQKSTKRQVAIKVVREGPLASRAEKLRFEREIKILAQLRHPNIVTIHDSGEAGGHAYYVMDYIPGQSLDKWSRSEPSIRAKLLLFAKLADAVAAAHQQGITHRDLKPGNVQVDENGEPHVLDFGLAKTTGALEVTQVTRTGQFMGSLPWASPEQAEAVPGKVDIRTDVYSLGVMLYEMLTGQLPYNMFGNMRDVLDRIINADPRRPSAVCGQIDHELETIVLKCLQKPSERRYQSAGELADDVRRYLAGEPIQARGDSLLYLAMTRGRRTLRRHSLLATLGAFVLIAYAWCSLERYVYYWIPAHEQFLRVLAWFAAGAGSSDFEHVRVIGLTDRTDIATLARQANLTNVDPANLRSLRCMHGALMERLADSGLKALVWDINFERPSEFDESLARGIRAVRSAGRDVLLTTRAWHIDSEPTFSPAVLKEAKWAAATGDMSAERPWSLDLTVERPENVPVPCLALAAVNAAFRPGAEFHLQVDGETCSLASRFWNTQGKRPLYGYYVQLTGRWPLTEDDPDFGLLRNDVVGHYYITIPPDDVLARCTIEYQDVFTADQEQLRRWLGQRIVIMGDLRTGVDRHPYPDGREVSGVYSHAAAIEAMSRYSAVRTPTENEAWVIISVAVLAGGLVALFLHRSLAKLGFLTLAMIVLAGLFAVEAYRDFGYLANPTVPILAALTSAAFVTVTRRRALNGSGAIQIEEKSQ